VHSSVSEVTVAYIANEFPNIVESYILEEIQALEARRIRVLCYSVSKPRDYHVQADPLKYAQKTIYLKPFKPNLLLKTALYTLRHLDQLNTLFFRIIFCRKERFLRKLKALVQLWQGIYFALLLKDQGVTHVHAHHGYSASFAAMVAARLLDIRSTLTLHGSDLLIERFYLDLKLEHCDLCFTISEYNKRMLMELVPSIEHEKVIVRRMGVACGETHTSDLSFRSSHSEFIILSVGRLHEVKNYKFLIRGCAELKSREHHFMCIILGGGKEKGSLKSLIAKLEMTREIKLLGEVERDFVGAFLKMADLFVLTSKSEGIPIVLMEAMLLKKVVLAPRITGIPELVVEGETGFLYAAEDMSDFVEKIENILHNKAALNHVSERGRAFVVENYDLERNTQEFVNRLLSLPRKDAHL
jgi:colanic acid/amylovoran biosynthesis glycosyltransferase